MGWTAALLLAALTVALDPASGEVLVRADAAPVGEVLARIRAVSRVNFMVDAAVEARPVTLEARFADGRAAVRGVAAAAGLLVEEAGGVLSVRRPAPPEAAGAKPVRVETDSLGRYVAPGSIDYPVRVLRDRPEDATARAEFGGFEARAGVGLIVAPTLKERALREYLEARPVYRAIFDRAGVSVGLRGDLDLRSVRAYLEEGRRRIYLEIAYSTGDRGARVAHLVYVLDAETTACKELVAFETDVPSPPQPQPQPAPPAGQ